MLHIAPSIMCADLLHLGDQLTLIEQGGADWLHVDIMDGNFVPGFTFGASMVEQFQRWGTLPIEVHLMSNNPLVHMNDFLAVNCQTITIHIEATPDIYRCVATIKRRGMRAGIALNPSTPLSTLSEILPEIDQVVIMTVTPGFIGLPLIRSCLTKAGKLQQLLRRRHLEHIKVVVDGGVKIHNIADIAALGVYGVVSGTGIFAEPDPAFAIQEMKRKSAAFYASDSSRV